MYICIYKYISSMGSVESTGLTLLIPRVSKTSLVFREHKFVSTCIRLTWIEIENPLGDCGLEQTFRLCSVHVWTLLLKPVFLRYITTSIVLSFVHYMTIWLGQHQPPPTSYKADAARAHYLPTCCRSPAPCSAHLARCIPQHQHSINITCIPQHCFHTFHCLPVCT